MSLRHLFRGMRPALVGAARAGPSAPGKRESPAGYGEG